MKKKYINNFLELIFKYNDVLKVFTRQIRRYSSYLNLPMHNLYNFNVISGYYQDFIDNIDYLCGIFKEIENCGGYTKLYREFISAMYNNEEVELYKYLGKLGTDKSNYFITDKIERVNYPQSLPELKITNIFLIDIPEIDGDTLRNIKSLFPDVKSIYFLNKKKSAKPTEMDEGGKLKLLAERSFIKLNLLNLTIEKSIKISDTHDTDIKNFLYLISSIKILNIKSMKDSYPTFNLRDSTNHRITEINIVDCKLEVNYLSLESLKKINITKNDLIQDLNIGISTEMESVNLKDIKNIKTLNLIPLDKMNKLAFLNIENIRKMSIISPNNIKSIRLINNGTITLQGITSLAVLDISNCIGVNIGSLRTCSNLKIINYIVTADEKFKDLISKCTDTLYLKNIEGFLLDVKLFLKLIKEKPGLKIKITRGNIYPDILTKNDDPRFMKIEIID